MVCGFLVSETALPRESCRLLRAVSPSRQIEALTGLVAGAGFEPTTFSL